MRRILLGTMLMLPLAACASDAQEAAPDTATVTIMKDAGVGHFHMPVVEVAAGGSVEWTNRSGVIHNVVFDDESITSSELFDDGEKFTTSFAKAGRYPYICTIHPAMTGAVVVS